MDLSKNYGLGESYMDKNIQAVLLAGGLGTRIREETANRPKPMIEIGGKPILWHLMKTLSNQGINRFIICTGYKADVVADFFANYLVRNNDFTVKISRESIIEIHSDSSNVEWEITVAYTGESEVGTGGRVNRIKKYIDTYPFLCTYGDGLADINIGNLFDFHYAHGEACSITTINPTNRFGVVELLNNKVMSFREKPKVEGWINGGFFLFEKEVWKYLDDFCTLEQEPLRRMSQEGKVFGYQHTGFWQSMDTYREYEYLSELWASGKAPWKTWI
jgi:glucose-1-phosphate cytidylyltransferase